MGRPRDTRRRVLGPYRDGASFRIAIIDGASDERRSDLTYPSKSAATRAKEKIEAEWHRLDEITVEAALKKYRDHLERKGNKPVSYTETIRRLKLFFSDEKRVLSTLTKRACERYYDAFADGRSADYHRNTLIEARSFLRWTAERGWLRTNPLDGCKGVGKRRKGKAQLTRDEARAFSVAAEQLATAGDMGALGAWMLLLLGVRQSEVWLRRVRDVDESGTLLRISGAKTERGNRLVEIPAVLRSHLDALTTERDGDALLFGAHTKSWLRCAVARVCKAAGVPRVTPHGLRGTHASLSVVGGATAHLVAAQLGHESVTTTLGHYAAPDATQAATQGRALAVIEGGRK